MTDTLSGINLRQALCEALGWRHAKNCPHDGVTEGCLWFDPEGWLQESPKYDSDATLFFALLDKVCKERGWVWECGNRCAGDAQGDYYCQIEAIELDDMLNVVTFGATLTEAGCRCLLSALKADTRKEK